MAFQKASSRATPPLAVMVLAATCLLAPSVAAQSTPPPDRASGLLARALTQGAGGDWATAAGTALRGGHVASLLLDWQRLRDGQGTWQEVLAFSEANPDWPGLALMHRRAEPEMAQNTPSPEQVRRFFATHAPATAAGSLALIDAHAALGDHAAARAEAVRLWHEFDLTEAQQARLLAAHGAELSAHHATRLDNLLWRGASAQVERLLPLMGPGYARLAEARLALRARAAGVNALIDRVPPDLADDGGLAWERFDWRINARNYESAAAWAVERSTSVEALGRPEAWARWRAFLVRRALSEGNPRLAYDLAANHFLEDGGQFADLEWLAGYVALRHLDRPETALRHFQNLRLRVGSPISLGRAGYWEGRAHAALGDMESARMAWAFGAEHQTSFYGLLSAERAGLPMDPALAGTEQFPPWNTAPWAGSEVLTAALLLHRAGEWHTARQFVMHIARGIDDRVALGQLGDLILELNEPNWAVNIAKIGALRELVVHRAYFPVTELAQMSLPVPTDLALAIARRESEFDHTVVSHADARGLMQVLPSTGALTARRLGVDFDEARLTRDPAFNAMLGAAYLAELKQEFGEAVILVAAGYNAGPGRPRRWVRELGDPRHPDVDAVDWIESVPFTETRNYIMRVMESLYVYRARLAGGPVEIRLSAEINGG